MIVIAPYSTALEGGRVNPKSYPHWEEVVASLRRMGQRTVQIGVSGEQRLNGVDDYRQGLSLDAIATLIRTCNTWLSVDSFLPHLCHCYGLKSGVVLWGVSDPLIFGYPTNINLLKARSYLRPHQFQTWNEYGYDPAAFVTATEVIAAVNQLLPAPAYA